MDKYKYILTLYKQNKKRKLVTFSCSNTDELLNFIYLWVCLGYFYNIEVHCE